MPLRPGLYERLVDQEVQAWLQSLAEKGLKSLKESPPDAEVPLLYARYLVPIVRQAVAEIRENRLERGRELVNSLVGEIARFMGDASWKRCRFSFPANIFSTTQFGRSPQKIAG